MMIDENVLIQIISEKSEEIGRLRTEVLMKDNIIKGLQSQLGLVTANTVNTECKIKEEVRPVVVTEPAEVSSTNVENMKTTTEVSSESVDKPKRGRPKGSKTNTVKKSKEDSSKNSIPGGSVFKDFVPLDLDNLLGENTSAFLSKKDDNKSLVLSAV